MATNDTYLDYALKELDDPLNWNGVTGNDLAEWYLNIDHLFQANSIGDSIDRMENMTKDNVFGIDSDIMRYAKEKALFDYDNPDEVKEAIENLESDEIIPKYKELEQKLRENGENPYTSESKDSKLLIALDNIADFYNEEAYNRALMDIGDRMRKAEIGEMQANSENYQKAIEICDMKERYNEDKIVARLAASYKVVANYGDLAKNVMINASGDDHTNIENIEQTTSTLQDIARHGINGGYGGFIYYEDTCKFFDENKDAIFKLLNELYQECAYGSEMEMLRSFNCFKGEDFSLKDIMEVNNFQGQGENPTHTMLKNGLAWYAGEEIANAFDNALDSYKSYNNTESIYYKAAQKDYEKFFDEKKQEILGINPQENTQKNANKQTKAQSKGNGR